MSLPDFSAATSRLRAFHHKAVHELGLLEPTASFLNDDWASSLGLGRTSILVAGSLFEKAGLGYSEVAANHLPPAASARRQHLAGKPFRAAGVSLVIHPLSPHVPTTHMNIRFFAVLDEPNGSAIDWWIGGGFDLTPFYPHEEDCLLWHQAAKDALDPFDPNLYPAAKKACDEYFYLPHRKESRGIGGIFFDDLQLGSPSLGLDLLESVGHAFLGAYREIISRRQNLTYTQSQKDFQLYRRGRYVEFNLLYDRGTLFGLQSGGRTESILMSMPPQANWIYGYEPQPGSPEVSLSEQFLKPRDWLGNLS
ncbi:MAG: oxygen-dependent coproporphyrinogen oxidase [Puniceicoccaceae bacterium]